MLDTGCVKLLMTVDLLKLLEGFGVCVICCCFFPPYLLVFQWPLETVDAVK